MDAVMDSVELVFAQRLSSGEPVIRRRALKVLHEHIKKYSKEKTFTNESLARLCKGLHYTMWMQDKMLLQEELADNIAYLINLFSSDEECVAFLEAFFFSLSREWPMIDRWRMDKFLMLMRRVFRAVFAKLASQNWTEPAISEYIELLKHTLISSTSNICESLKYHCASIYLDELDNAGGIDEQLLLKLIKPYVDLLGERISDSYFHSICTEIFGSILRDFSDKLLATESINAHRDEKAGTGQEEAELQFNYAALGELVYKVGTLVNISSKRRRRIYALARKFDAAARGRDPFAIENQIIMSTRKRKRRQ